MPSGETQRLFLGVAIADEVRHGLAAHLDAALDGKPVPGRPVPPENWHITLRFLGATPPAAREKLLHAVESADLGGRFTLGFAGLGAFPRQARATVLWLGVGRGEERLGELAAAAEEAAVGSGWLMEERPFHAHLTLSRIRPHQDVTAVITREPAFPLTQAVEEIVLFRSRLGGGKPARYDVIERFEVG